MHGRTLCAAILEHKWDDFECAEISPKRARFGGFMPVLGGNMQKRALT